MIPRANITAWRASAPWPDSIVSVVGEEDNVFEPGAPEPTACAHSLCTLAPPSIRVAIPAPQKSVPPTAIAPAPSGIRSASTRSRVCADAAATDEVGARARETDRRTTGDSRGWINNNVVLKVAV